MGQRRVGEDQRSEFKQCFWKENKELYFSVLIFTSLNYATTQICTAFLPHGGACHGSPWRNVPAYQSGCHLQLPCNSPAPWGLGAPTFPPKNLQRSLPRVLPLVGCSYPTTTLVPGELEAASDCAQSQRDHQAPTQEKPLSPRRQKSPFECGACAVMGSLRAFSYRDSSFPPLRCLQTQNSASGQVWGSSTGCIHQRLCSNGQLNNNPRKPPGMLLPASFS